MTEDLAAIQMVTQLGEDVQAMQIANRLLEASGVMLQAPGLVRLYEVIAAEMAATVERLSRELDSI